MDSTVIDAVAVDLRRLLVSALIEQDDASQRGRHPTDLSPSDLCGCRPQAWLKMRGEPTTNAHVKRLPAIVGTAIHEHIRRALLRRDPFGDMLVLETRVDRDGMGGTIDLLWLRPGDTPLRIVVDWKTMKKANLRYFPKDEQRVQVHTYGYLVGDVDLVALVGIPKDGTEDQIDVRVEEYDPRWYDLGQQWKADVESRTVLPPPERPAKTFCAVYCDWWGRCPGR